MSMTPAVYDLGAEHGRVLSTRESGREAGRHVADSLSGTKCALILGFWGVDVVSPSYADEVLRAVRSELWGGNSSRLLIVTGYNEDVRESLEIVLERNGLAMAALDEYGHLELLGGAKHLRETLEAAQKLGHFTAPQLAECLEVKLPNLHARIKVLTEAGALARDEADMSVATGRAGGSRGAARRYRAPDVTVLTTARP